jgi:predicted PurR-regulated permease PerM
MTPITIMLVIVYLLEPLVKFYQRRLNKNASKNRRALSVAFTFLTVFLVISAFISIILPSILSSVESIVHKLPNSTAQITEIILSFPFVNLFADETMINTFFKNFSTILVSFSENIIGYSTNIIVSFKDALIAVGIFILSILMAFYALRDYETIGENIELHLRSIFGDHLINPLIRVFHMTDKAMKSFLIGKLYTCIILGLMIGLFGLIFNLISPKDIPYLPLIAFIIGLTNIIPYVGPFIGTIPSLVFVLINGFIPAVALLAIVLIAQQIDNIFISPKVIGNSVGLKPFWILLSVTVGGRLFGILGLLFTVPITSVILALLDERINEYKKTNEGKVDTQ